MNILVIGSAHVDVIGDATDDGTVDKMGKVSFFVGGTGYNIAANLARSKSNNVSLFTYLQKSSLISKLVYNKVYSSGIRRENIRRLDIIGGRPVPESAFVAHRNSETRDLVSAISGMALSEIPLEEDSKELKRLNKCIGQAHAIIVDCNCLTQSIEVILKSAAESNKDVFVAGVSETKIFHYLHAASVVGPTEYARFISMNDREARFALGRLGVSIDMDTLISPGKKEPALAKMLCDKFCAEWVCITNRRGFLLAHCKNGGECVELDLQLGTAMRSTTGSGDALMAALVEIYCESGSLPIEDCNRRSEMIARARSKVEKVLRVPGATPGADMSFDPNSLSNGEWLVRRWLRNIWRFCSRVFVEKLLEYSVVAFVAIIVAMLFRDWLSANECERKISRSQVAIYSLE